MRSRWACARRVALLVVPLALFAVAAVRAQAQQPSAGDAARSATGDAATGGAATGGAATGGAATAHVTLSFERIGFPVPRFTLDIDRSGRGAYAGEQATPVVRGVATEPATQPFDRSLTVSSATADKVFALAAQLDHFNVTCATKAKNLADIGTKTLRYAGPDASGSCAFIYSENKSVTELTELLHGIAETMDAGRELDRLHRYDRLGLDDAMAELAGEVAAGRARELETIAPTLRSIAADADVLQRVRVRAAALLSLIPPDAAAR